MNLNGVNVLVTGGCGFIGGHLVEELIEKGAKVTVVDINLNPQSTFALNKLENKSELKFLDIRDRINVLRLFKQVQPSYVFHLAAQPLVEEAYLSPFVNFETNIMGTVNVLDGVSFARSVKGIIVASSDKAYGKSKKAYQEDFPLKGDHPYDVSKSSQDLIAQSYFRTYDLPVVITRFGNVYGQGDFHFSRIIPGICEAIIKNKPLLVRSNGRYIRDYIYVKDVVNGYIFLLKNIDRLKGNAFNFSSKDGLSVINLIKLVEKILRVKIPYKILNTAQNEIPYQHLDDRKIRRIRWKPNYTIENTFPKVLAWYNENGIFRLT